jgi:hypothetical protein
MRWWRHVARTGSRNAYKILILKLGEHWEEGGRCRYHDDNEVYLDEKVLIRSSWLRLESSCEHML